MFEVSLLRAKLADLDSEQSDAARQISQAPATVVAKVGAIALLGVSILMLGAGTLRGWSHLKSIREGRAQHGTGLAMFAALFLPLILLFIAVLALIYIPASNANGLGRSIGTSLAFIAAFGACFWSIRSTWRWIHPRPDTRSTSAGPIVGCLAAFVVVAVIAIPVAMIAY